MIVIVATDKPASKKVTLGLLLAAVVNLRVSTGSGQVQHMVTWKPDSQLIVSKGKLERQIFTQYTENSIGPLLTAAAAEQGVI